MDELILDLLDQKVFEIVFLQNSARIIIHDKDIFDKSVLNKEAFSKNMKLLIESLVDLSDDNENEPQNEIKELLSKYLDKYPTSIQELKIKKNSLLNFYDEIGFEILTKRDDKNFCEILGHTLLVKMKNSNHKEDISTLFEVTKLDLDRLISYLSKYRDEIDSLNNYK